MSELEKCLNGEDFNSSAPELLEIIAHGRKLIKDYNHTDVHEVEKKRQILKNLLGKIGQNVSIDTPFYCDYGCHIHIGNQVIIGMNCTFIDNHYIRIGNYTMIASNVKIYTATHPTVAQERIKNQWSVDSKVGNFYHTTAHPVSVGKEVWIGGGATILPGVKIGDGSVIGAGSVVTKNIPAKVLAVGNPCKVIRKL